MKLRKYNLVAFPHSLNMLLTALMSVIDETEIIVMSLFTHSCNSLTLNFLLIKFLDLLDFYKLVSPLDFSHPVSWL